jgi:hypothetical protein
VAPEALAEDVTRHAIGDTRLLVVKDLAIDSPLLTTRPTRTARLPAGLAGTRLR